MSIWSDMAKAVGLFFAISLIVFAIVFGIARLVFHFREKEDNARWNNGVCECGGNYEYEQAVGHRVDTSYIYKCEQCNRRIEVSSFKERQDD